MKKLVFAAALMAAGGLCLHDISVGHGGTYRGPGDTVPPGGGGGGGGGGPSSGPTGPSSPGPAGPAGPGRSSPGRPASGGGNPNTPKSGTPGAGEDLSGWEFWWGFNKEPYLNLKAAIHSGGAATGSDDFFLGKGEQGKAKDSMKPSEEMIRQQVVPALLKALEGERHNDIVTGCMIALAKIGDPKNESGEGKEGFANILSAFLSDSSQEIKETAAVSLGILGNESSIDPLAALAFNTPEGRALVSKGNAASDVDDRTRSFAIFGLGLIGYRTESEDSRKKIVDALVEVLTGPGLQSAQRDMSVAALTAIGLVPLESNPNWKVPEEKDQTWKASECREAQVEWLLNYYADEDGVNYLVRAHVPTTLARLVQFADPRSLFLNDADKSFRPLKEKIAKVLIQDIDKRSSASTEIQQSAILALGLIGDADADEIDVEIRNALIATDELADPQSRNFAMVSLAHVGGRPGYGEGPADAGTADVRKELVRQLAKGQSARLPWAAIGLGVLERSLVEAQGVSPSPEVAANLRSALEKAKQPREVSSLGIALGIMKDTESKSILLDKLATIGDPDTRGYCAVALGLLGDTGVTETIQEVVRNSKFRAELLRSAAIALGLLGDKAIVSELTAMLAEASALSSQAAISQALGFIGDSRSIPPLVEMLENKSLTGGARGFAAVALGIVADKEELPWNAKISVNLNYRANTPTLTESSEGTGILDIL